MYIKYKYRLILTIKLLLFTAQVTVAQPISIDDIYKHLLTTFPQYNNITYNKPSTNYFVPNHWLLQTPNIWGTSVEKYNQGFTPVGDNIIDKQFFVPTCHAQSDCLGVSICKRAEFTLDDRKLCLTNAHDILENIYSTIIKAESSIDIVTLGKTSLSTGAFTSMLRNAITTLGYKTINSPHPIMVRLLYGTYHETPSMFIKDYLRNITANLPTKNKLVVSVTSVRSCMFRSNCGNEDVQHDIVLDFAWNHGKVIVVDKNILITGGENLWGDDYLEARPANDSNLKIFGAVASGATIYANILWDYVRHNPGLDVNRCYTYKDGAISKKCAHLFKVDTEFNNNSLRHLNDLNVQAMFVSKLNNGVGIGNDADQSELARVFALKNATSSIKISQQAFFMRGLLNNPLKHKMLPPLDTINGNIIQAIAYAIYYNSVDTQIITSNLTMTDSAYVNLQYLYNYILQTIISEYKVDRKAATKKLNQHLHLAYMSYNNIANKHIRNHNKFWMVDDKIFYFGSHNFFPSSLQQFGIIIDSREAAKSLIKSYWNPMWQYSAKLRK
ncbi:phospholipase D-like domain-containing protein [Candidatus Tisiphia endosymbiont of Hybos culiciformis]|uniref:phospholipase D-like domain-containing protein n=1 Tax=Candidatus Tisiphia endosymbiont of Hybos culiciformis TaxID=3139331 RepID=UPI003CCB4FBD